MNRGWLYNEAALQRPLGWLLTRVLVRNRKWAAVQSISRGNKCHTLCEYRRSDSVTKLRAGGKWEKHSFASPSTPTGKVTLTRPWKSRRMQSKCGQPRSSAGGYWLGKAMWSGDLLNICWRKRFQLTGTSLTDAWMSPRKTGVCAPSRRQNGTTYKRCCRTDSHSLLAVGRVRFLFLHVAHTKGSRRHQVRHPISYLWRVRVTWRETEPWPPFFEARAR